MPSCLTPTPALLAKLGSIMQHFNEGTSETGHAFDIETIKALIADPEVVEWLAEMDGLALLPKRR